MNSRAFVAFLVVLIVVIVAGWFILIHPSTPAPAPTTTATTTQPTTPVVVQDQSSTAPSDPATVAANIAGNWQSTDDSNYTVQITSGGKWTDSYKGSDASSSVSEMGTYTLFSSTDPDKNFTGVLVPGVVYVKVVEGSSTLYFSVLAASGNVLQLSYLDRGNTLSFVKVQ